jgi:hypothetical protein
MVKTGIPFMLHDSTGSLLESNFIELYDRMNLRVSCLSRDPNGAALYEVYNMLSRYHNIPVAVFEYGAAGALGNISLTGPGGSLRTQTMAAFLVEVGGYANAISPFPSSPSAPFVYKRSCRVSAKHRPHHRKFIASDGHEYSWSWRTSTDEDLEWSVSILLYILGQGLSNSCRVYSASMQVDLLLHGTRFHHLVVCLASRSHIRIS